MEFSRQKYWSGYPFPSPGDLPNPGIKPRSPALRADSSPAEPQGKPQSMDQRSLQSSQQGNFPDGPVTKPPNAGSLDSTSGVSKLDPMCHN